MIPSARGIVALAAGLLCVLLGYLLLWPVAVEPRVFTPPVNPGMTGPFSPNEAMRTAQQLAVGIGEGPEDVAQGPEGFFYTGLQDGRVVRFREDGSQPQTFINTNGRPLGMQFDRGGNLIVADAFRGLLSIRPDGAITVLTDAVDGQRLLFVNDVDIASDGEIWFTNASQRFDQHHWRSDFLETRPTGSLLRYDPITRTTTVALTGLMFANGVAVDPAGEYVLVNETIAARIRRLWLRGPRSGQQEVLLSLPAYPDNLSSNGRGIFWVALAAPRYERLERTWNTPWMRTLLARLPEAVIAWKMPPPFSWVIGIDGEGRVVHNFQDSSGRSGTVTSVNEFDCALYLGSITTSFVSRYPLP